MVKQEILKRKEKDDLALWMSNLLIGRLVNHKEQDIVNKYAEVLQYIQDNPCYSEKALREWAEETVADAWLIAAAKVYGFTIVTFEKPVLVDSNNPSKKAKIPNIAQHFGVRTIDLFGMIRELKIAF